MKTKNKSKKRKAMALAICTVFLVAVVPIPISGMQLSQPTSAPRTPYVGEIFTGTYLKIGIEDQYGDFGVEDPVTGEPVGFQYPIGTAYESLAIGWWGEGYVIAYDGEVFYHQPNYGTYGNMTPLWDWVISDTPTKAEYVVAAQAGDIRAYFYFVFPKASSNVYLYTILQNTGTTTLSDVYYKRLVDWDVGSSPGTDDWTWFAPYNAAIAWDDVPGVGTVYNYVIGDPAPDLYDLEAWDDMDIVGVGASYVTSNFPAVMADYDGNVGLHWKLGSLRPGDYKVICTVYGAFSSKTASTSLAEELRDVSETAQDEYNKIICISEKAATPESKPTQLQEIATGIGEQIGTK